MATQKYRLEIVLTGWESVTNCPYESKILQNNDNAGYDVYCRKLTNIPNVALSNGKGTLIPLGLKARLVHLGEVESDSHYWLLPRSSIYKTPLMMANSVGVIDRTYRGELMAPVRSNGPEYNVDVGERYFQIVAPDMGWISEIRVVESLPETIRGEGGFGSTGLLGVAPH
jgi:deoxyuridine 5'-triphosphate nucleotidohydrolase